MQISSNVKMLCVTEYISSQLIEEFCNVMMALLLVLVATRVVRPTVKSHWSKILSQTSLY